MDPSLCRELFEVGRRHRRRDQIADFTLAQAVIGVARFETNSDPALCAIPGSYRELPRMVVLDAPENGPLLISDDSGVLE